jgi:FkbM family methyltransferase
VTPWIFRIPGLRRYGRQLQHLRQQLLDRGAKLENLRGRARADRADFARRIQDHKSRQLAPDVLRGVLGPRHRALTARADAAAVAREAAFTGRSEAYAEAIAQQSSAAPDAVHRVSIEGIEWSVPEDAGGGGDLSDRIRHGWLPLHDILATRELAVGTAMIDVGANVGTTSITRVILGDFQYVYAAEPDPDNYACLVENVTANHLRGLVLPDRVAVGACDGTATLRRLPKIGVHHLVQGPAAPSDISVRSVTLDSWVARLGIDPYAVSFVKVDTQGWEADVLRGASRLLALPHIAWQIEFSPRLLKRSRSSAGDVLELLERHFTHFIDLGRTTAPRSRPITFLRDAVAYVERRERRFTDLLVYRAATPAD